MSCGCQGETTPKVSGTEVTILSGTTSARRNPEAESGNGVYYVAGGALLVAIIAFFSTRK